jgi:hypothetical protein
MRCVKLINRLILFLGEIWIYLAIVVFYLLMYFSSWYAIKIQNLGGGHKYIDMKSVIRAADCYKSIGLDVYSVSNDCSYQYGVFFLQTINVFHIEKLPLAYLGGVAIFLVLFFIFYLINLTKPGNIKKQMHIFFYSISPGLWLLFERGNFDWLIFVLVVLGGIFLSTSLGLIGFGIIAVSTLIKFYTFPLLIFTSLLVRGKTSRIISILVTILILPFIIWNVSIVKSFPYSLYVSFGSPILVLWANFISLKLNLKFVFPDLLAHLIGIFLFVLFSSILVKNTRIKLFFSLNSVPIIKSRNSLLYLFFCVLYLSCYLAGTSYSYRLIILVSILILCSKVNPELFGNNAFQFLAYSSLWLSYFFFGATGKVAVILAMWSNIAQLLIGAIICFELLRARSLLSQTKLVPINKRRLRL